MEAGSYEKSNLSQLLHKDLEATNQLISDQLKTTSFLMAEIASYLIQLGGKRLRPLMTLASARIFGYDGDNHIPLAACIEFIHTATLLHDDVIDKSKTRRGAATAHTLWGQKPSILVGDFLLSQAFHLMMTVRDWEIMETLCYTARTLAEGELCQLTLHQRLDITLDTYFEMVAAKTGCLFQAACTIGALLSPEGRAQAHNFNAYGLNLGIAFQLIDDYLDYTAPTESFGKENCQDLISQKMTLPVLLSYQNGESTERAFWKELFSQDTPPSIDQKAQALSILEYTQGLEQTKEMAQMYSQRATKALSSLPFSPLKQALLEVAQLTIQRKL